MDDVTDCLTMFGLGTTNLPFIVVGFGTTPTRFIDANAAAEAGGALARYFGITRCC